MESYIIYPLAVLAIGQLWVVYSRWRNERRQVLQERVTLMLWTAAEESAKSRFSENVVRNN